MRHSFAKRSKHKYKARATVVDGIRFDSAKESRYFQQLKLRQQAGEVLCFIAVGDGKAILGAIWPMI